MVLHCGLNWLYYRQCLPQRVFRSPQTPNIKTYNLYRSSALPTCIIHTPGRPVHLSGSNLSLMFELVMFQRASDVSIVVHIYSYSTYKMALLCVLYILLDAQFISAGANTDYRWSTDKILYHTVMTCGDSHYIHTVVLLLLSNIFQELSGEKLASSPVSPVQEIPLTSAGSPPMLVYQSPSDFL